MSRKDVTQILLQAAIDYFVHYKHGVYTEIGLLRHGKLRADLFAVDLRGNTSIVEIKSSWADFKADQKFQNYFKYSNKFYLVISEALYNEHRAIFSKIAKKHTIGILILAKNGYLYSKHRATYYKVNSKIRYNMLCRLAWRAATYSRRNRPRRQRRYLV